MESLRNDTPLFFGIFTIAQIISIGMFVVSVSLFTIIRLKSTEKDVRR